MPSLLRSGRVRRLRIGLVLTGVASVVLAGLSPVPGVLVPPPAEAAEPTAVELDTALSEARRTGKRVEVLGKRSETETTFAEPSGKVTTEVSSVPVRVRKGDAWAAVDPSLQAQDGVWKAKASTAEVALSPGGSSTAPLVTAGRGSRSLSLGWGSSLPKPSIDGATATYALDSDRALRVTATATGFRSHLILDRQPESPLVARFPLRLSGLSITQQPDGGFAIADPAGRTVLEIAAPLMWDASKDAAGDPARIARVDARVVMVNGERVLELTPDAEFLSSATYPVTVDPDITASAARDTYVSSGFPDTTYASATYLRTGLEGSAKKRAFDQFAMPQGVAGAQITSAQLKLFNYYAPSCTAKTLYLWPVTEYWTTGTTWNNQPPADSSSPYATSKSFAHGASGCGAADESIDVTAMTRAWTDGLVPNHGWMLRANEFDSAALKVFCSGNEDPAHTYCKTAARSPRLVITYDPDVVPLATPTVVHSNGAQLRWARYSGASFDKYEVHRSTTAGFTPSAATLLSTIRAQEVTRYTDTTAKPNTTFRYKVVANSSPSNEISVTTPAAGKATMTLQPDAARGQATTLMKVDGQTGCTYAERNLGARTTMRMGVHTSTSVGRPLLKFDLRDIPVGAIVDSATLQLTSVGSTNGQQSRQINLYRATRAWREGTAGGGGVCNGSGATWNEADFGQSWTTPLGGDFDPTLIDSEPAKSRAATITDSFTVKSLVQQWVDGDAPNHGMLLKYSSETIPTSGVWFFEYYADDAGSADASRRPKLEVTYNDGSVSRGPRVTVSAPGKNATVSGTDVTLAAAAGDDRRVEQVEFLVDGTVKATDTTAPYTASWNSTTVGNGAHTITAKATDDVGNTTTSTAVPVTVDNTAPPTGSLTAPAAGATVSGTSVTLSASASDDAGVAKVEFLIDGDRVGAPDTTAPYSVQWNTLDPLARIFDGSHELTAAITDTSGQTTVTAARTVTLNNRGTSKYKATLELNDPATTADDVFPQLMTEDPTAPTNDPYAGTTNPDGTANGSANKSLWSAPPARGNPSSQCPEGAYCPTVTVTNTSGQAWQNADADMDLWYAWYAPNGARLFEGPAVEKFPNSNFAAGATKTFNVVIKPPALPPGAELGDYRLRIDLYDLAADNGNGDWFSQHGNKPIDHPIQVAKKIDDNLGLERFWHYEGESLGAGMSTMTNVANGNMLWRWSPFFAPGRGLSTMLDLTYNSREDHSKSPAGNNVSLSISGLIRFGEPLDIHPNKADDISGHAKKWVEFVDGDGTVHRFNWDTTNNRWTEPPGVNLYLNSIDGDPQGRKWKLVRPDKVTFYFDADGYPKSVEDRNGNKLTFTVTDTPPGEDPGGPKKRITKVTDPGGRDFTLDYYSKDEAKRAHVRGNIQRITDHSGSALEFDYYDDGNLLRLTQVGGTKANGEHLPDRSFVFTYTTSSGDAAAIPAAADRVDPNPRTPNQSTRLFSVRDPRGHETTYDYYGPSEGPHDRWKLQKRTNRTNDSTSYGYDITNRVTTVTDPLLRETKFSYDTDGKVTKIVDPANRDTLVAWSSDFKVEKVTEPSGKFSSFTYNANGYLTAQTNQVGEKTVLDYGNSPADAQDQGNHLSQLTTVTKPKGVATQTPTNDFQWVFDYDGAGNVNTVEDPTGAVTDYDHNLAGSTDPGTIAQVKDPNAVADGTAATVFNTYDPSGQPTKVTDPEGNVTRYDYDVDGQLRSVQDPNHASDTGSDERAYKAFYDYDAFHRLGRQSMPKSTQADRGTLIWSGAEFDANDNTITTIDAHYGPDTDPEGAPTGSATYDDMDRPLVVANSDTSVDPEGERTKLEYDDAGRVKQVSGPKGALSTTVDDDHATIPTYDSLDRVIKQTVTGANVTDKRITHNCYDPLTDDLTSVTLPRANLDTVTCSDTTRPFTWTYTYDAAHRVTSQTDPEGHQQKVTYDANGNPTTTKGDIDAANNRFAETTNTYDQRDALIKVEEKFNSSRNVVTRFDYDNNGNRTELISPRGHDAGNGNYVTGYQYDKINRLVRTALPFDTADGTERQYVHQAYDANGNLTSTSLPVINSGSAGDGATTKMSYFDPGWIRASGDPVNPTVQFNYTAHGWQAERVPENPSGDSNEELTMRWSYFNDGQLKTRRDQGGQPSTYSYDTNNNLTDALDAAGITDPGEKAVATEASYTGFDEPNKVRFRKGTSGDWTFSDYTYDRNGNVTLRLENGKETDAGSQTTAPRRYEMDYDSADWITEQRNLGVDSFCNGDQRIVNTFFDSGWEKQRLHYRAGSGCTADVSTWTKRQRTTWDHFDNGKLKTLARFAYNTAQTETETEHHDLGYLDGNDRYVNGHRTTDHYWLKPKGSTGSCISSGSACDAKFSYDARDKLIEHQLRAGRIDTYTLDQPGQLLGDDTVRAGNVTREEKAGKVTTRKYDANQLTEATVTENGVSATTKFWYDPLGNLDCVTKAAGTRADCSPDDTGAISANLVTDYAYDYLNRLARFHAYDNGTRTDRGVYTYDALDRTIKEVEDHEGATKDRTKMFAYQGLSNLITQEDQTGGSNPKIKAYSYDNAGHRIGFSDTNKTTGKVNTYTFGHDAHGSVSQLIALGGDEVTPGDVEASYGYDAYGGQDKALTTGDDDNQTPLNPYRYTGKRMDSATATTPDADAQYDMGARRWGPANTRFLQQDIYYGALANLGLATDPLTQNTYALAGANPISYIEYDGHRPVSPAPGGGAYEEGYGSGIGASGSSGSANTVVGGLTSGVGIERTATPSTADVEQAVQAMTEFFKKTGNSSTDRLEFVAGVGQFGADTVQLLSDAHNPYPIAANALGQEASGPSQWYEDAVTELGINTNSVGYKMGEISATVGSVFAGGAGIIKGVGSGLTRLAGVGIASTKNWHLSLKLAGKAPPPNATVRDLTKLAPGNPARSGKITNAGHRSDEDLMKSVFQPQDGQFMAVHASVPGTLLQGNHRRLELLRRAADPLSDISLDTPIFIQGW